DAYGDDAYADDYDAAYDDAYEDVYDDDVYGEPAPTAAAPAAPRRRAPRRSPRRSADRDLRTAVLVGVGFLGVALALFATLGPLGGMIVAVPVLGYAAYEYFVAVNTARYEAPMPVGVAAVAGMVLATYNYGEQAIPPVLVLAVAACFRRYPVRAGGGRPVRNIAVRRLGVGWIGVLGAFAGLLLAARSGSGVALLLAAGIPTIGYDVGALFVGRSAGSRPLSAASPN